MKELFLSYLQAGLFGSVIILLVILLRLLLRKAPRRMLCVLWMLAALRLLLPFHLESVLSLQPQNISTQILSANRNEFTADADDPVSDFISQAPSANTPENMPESSPNPVPESQPQISTDTPENVPEFSPEPVPESQPQISTDTPTHLPMDILQLLSTLWLVGLGASLVYTLITYSYFRHTVRDAVRREKGCFESSKLRGAFLLGYIRPRIYMPANLSDQDRQFIIAHERSHISRGDNWWKLLGFVCSCIHWYNPLVWLAYWLLCQDIERACDEQVICSLSLEERKAYSTALLNCGKSLSKLSACPVAFAENNLKQRIKSILSYRRPSLWIILATTAAILFTAVCFLTSPGDTPKQQDSTLQTHPTDATETLAPTQHSTLPDDATIPPESSDPLPEETTVPEQTTPPQEETTTPEQTDPPQNETVSPPTPTTPPVTQPNPTTPQPDLPIDDSIIAGKNDGRLGINWTLDRDGVLTVAIPRLFQSCLHGGYPWSAYADQVKTLVLRGNATNIPGYAFADMHNLTQIDWGNSLESIGESAFMNCTSLTSVTFPKTLKTIGEGAFGNCTALQKLYYAEDGQLQTIGSYAFSCSGLTEFISPASLRTIDAYAFNECYSLRTVILQGGIETVKPRAFEKCTVVRHLILGESIKDLGGYVLNKGATFLETLEIYTDQHVDVSTQKQYLKTIIIGGKATTPPNILSCPVLETVILGPSVTKFHYGISHCPMLTKLTIPASVTYLPPSAFTGCGITELYFEGSPPAYTMHPLANITATVYYPADDPNWTSDIMAAYSGNITWVPYTPGA